MEWSPDTDLEKMIVCAAPYGGPIAVMRDTRLFIKVTGLAKPVIRIFTSSGHLISTINVRIFIHIIVIYLIYYTS